MKKNILSTMPVKAIALLLPVSALALTACSSGGSDAPQDITPKQITSADQLDMPVREYEPAAADIKIVGAAAEELTKRCMEKYGIQNYTATNWGGIDDNFLDVIYASRYGLIDRDQAQKSGYIPSELSDPATTTPVIPSDLEVEVMSGMTTDGTPSTRAAADGTPLPEGGCSGAASRELEPDEMAGMDALNSIETDALSKTAADPRAIAAQDAWSQCMKQAGYDFATREDASMQMVSSTAPIEEQTRQAVADVDCAISTNYVGIWNAIDAAFQRQLIGEREGDLQAAQEAQKAMIAKATAIVQGNQ